MYTCVQEVVLQLEQLLSGDDAASSPHTGDGSNGSSNGISNGSKYVISCHPQVPVAVLLQGSGPHPVDIHTGEQGCVCRK